MKRNLHLSVLAAILLGFTLIAIPEMYFQAFGAPGKGTGITILNSIAGPDPAPEWSYSILELNPAGKSPPFAENFNLKTDGTGLWSITGLKAGQYLVSRGPEVYVFAYPPVINITSTMKGSHIVTGFSTIITLAPSEYVTLDFMNEALPAFSIRGLGESPPSDLNYNIPVLQPIPVQSTWNVDINNNGKIDLVAGKLTTILVNITGTSLPVGSQISILFEGKTYTKPVLSGTSIVAFTSIVPSIVTSSETITGSFEGGNLITTYVTVKDTGALSLYYIPLTKSDYGTESGDDLDIMSEESSSFVNATYPIENLYTNVAATAMTGANKGTSRSPYSGILADAMAAAQQAQLFMGGSAVGIAVGPISATTDYFTYHGFPGAAGISFGPSVKGVVVLDGYYTAPAHEIAHTFGLYYGVPEQYQTYPPQGKSASGVSSVDGTWRTGYDFMGLAPYETTSFTWVTDTTYEDIFKQTSINPADPEILLVSGIVYSNGTVDTSSFPWYHLEDGIPDTLTPGNYSLDFIARGEKLLNRTSFDLQFSVDFCPGIGIGNKIDNSGFENRETDFSGFSFATEFHEKTYKVQIMNNTDPDNSEIMAIVYVSDMIDGPAAITYSLNSNTSNHWFTSEVVLTMFATAVLPAIFTRLLWILFHSRLQAGKITASLQEANKERWR